MFQSRQGIPRSRKLRIDRKCAFVPGSCFRLPACTLTKIAQPQEGKSVERDDVSLKRIHPNATRRGWMRTAEQMLVFRKQRLQIVVVGFRPDLGKQTLLVRPVLGVETVI